MSILKTVFKGICALLGVLLVLVAGVFGYNVYTVHGRSVAARDAAEAFCAAHQAGTPIARALASAGAAQVRAVPLTGGDGYVVEYMYFLDGWGCELRTAADTITGTAIVAVN